MTQTSPPGPEPQHSRFVSWSKEQGVKIHGVELARLNGPGLGIVATHKIEAGEELIDVPFSALLTTNSVPTDFQLKHKGITVHGLLASFLAFGGPHTHRYADWKALWPSFSDFQKSMPLLWFPVLREPLNESGYSDNTMDNAPSRKPFFPLPPSIAGRWSHNSMDQSLWERDNSSMLCRQEAKLQKDWSIVSKVFPDQTLPEYTYYWMVVNTRSFYFEIPGEEPAKERDDRIALCPFMDYFNHGDQGCKVTFDEKGFTVSSDRAYAAGEELHISYGGHSNDFLLVEYGFILDQNKHDSLPLDDFFTGDRLNANTKNRLRNADYYGNYTLTSEGPCHRTEVAIRTQSLSIYHWKRFVAGLSVRYVYFQSHAFPNRISAAVHTYCRCFHPRPYLAGGSAECGTFISDEQDELKAKTYLKFEILRVYYETASYAIGKLENMEGKIPEGARTVLLKRWRQIREMVVEVGGEGCEELFETEKDADVGL